MSEQQNVQAVQAMYAAFGNGDIQGILAHLSEEVEWRAYSPYDASLARTYTGHAGVGQFFQELNAAMSMDVFEPKEYVAQGDKVVALGNLQTTMRNTGEATRTDFAMLWTFRDGKAIRFFEYGNDAPVQ